MDKINFEWPTQSMMDEMETPEKVQMKSITFSKVSSDAISRVQCTLSNGMTSPVFEVQSANHEAEKTIEFDVN